MKSLPIIALAAALSVGLYISTISQAQNPTALAPAGQSSILHGPRITFSDDFEKGAYMWKPTRDASWKVVEDGGSKVLSQFEHSTQYQPPHRSPHNIAFLKDITVGDFELTVRVKSTKEYYNHRSACVFFGYQDPAHFYYVHFGQSMDDHANQVFIVNEADRLKISTKTTDGTPWDDQWHNVKITRNAESGEITVYFDDMETPVMTAVDKTFTWGQVGVGSFDDTANWDDLKLVGSLAERKPREEATATAAE